MRGEADRFCVISHAVNGRYSELQHAQERHAENH
jgi:hypothetical protein